VTKGSSSSLRGTEVFTEFAKQVVAARTTPLKRPQVQAKTRAIQESMKPAPRRQGQSGLAYPYPGKGVSGETSN
jgi:hypothetical protein